MMLYEQRPLLVMLDVETQIILGTVPTVACGQMLMMGMLNTQINYFPIQVALRRTEWDAYDFNAADAVYCFGKKWAVTPAPADLVTPHIVARRKLLRLRASYLQAWEVYCKGALARFKGYMSDGVQAFIRHEIESGVASSYVQEYASIYDIDPGNALEELSSKVRSLGVVEARNWAQYEKIALRMTMASTREELDEIMRQGFGVLYGNAFI
jgi:hypothetical protein